MMASKRVCSLHIPSLAVSPTKASMYRCSKPYCFRLENILSSAARFFWLGRLGLAETHKKGHTALDKVFTFFNPKSTDIFLIVHENICYGFSLEEMIIAPEKRGYPENIFFFSMETYIVDTH